MSQIVELDKQITLAINNFCCPASDAFWSFITVGAVSIPIYIAILALFIWKLGWKKALLMLGTILIAFVICEQTANIVKYAVQRFRPCWDEDMINRGIRILSTPGGKYGFFSSHSCNSFCIATGAVMATRAFTDKKWIGLTIGLYTWATLIAFSRVFVAKHFFGDILVGAIVGIAISYACMKLAIYLITKRAGQSPS